MCEEETEEMLSMKQVDTIKELQRNGTGPSEIAEKMNIDRKTVSKYMKLDDLNFKALLRHFASVMGWLEV